MCVSIVARRKTAEACSRVACAPEVRAPILSDYWSVLASGELLAAPDRLVSPEDEAVRIEAIAQHYGPGSTFLDVTRSLDVALAIRFRMHRDHRATSNAIRWGP